MTKHFKEEFKIQVVNDYLGGMRYTDVCKKYEINEGRIRKWTKQFRETGRCEDQTGRKSGPGKGRSHKVNTEGMTKDEYIRYLEMENEILKQLRSLSSRRQR